MIFSECDLVQREKVVIENAEAVTVEARLAAGGMIGRLRIGFTQIALYQRLPQLLRRFRSTYPRVETETQELI